MGIIVSNVSFGQITTSTINGVITDKNNKKIEHAKVEIILKSKGITRGTFTDENGRFKFYLIEVGGPYTLKITKLNYREYNKKNLEFDLGDNDINVKLETED